MVSDASKKKAAAAAKRGGKVAAAAASSKAAAAKAQKAADKVTNGITDIQISDRTCRHDLEACVWLEENLKKFDCILVVVSHSQDFLNGVCTNIIHMQNKKLKLYTGNYDQYVQTRAELEENQMRQYKWEQEQIASMKEYIARFGHGSAKLARQAQSKEKALAKMERGGLIEKVVRDKVLVFRFTDVGKLPPPVL